GYTALTGAIELLGGVLLFSRRTTTLGALVCIGVMANIVALNFLYDIPVKLFSSHLLAVALVLVALDGRRLIAVFLRGEAVPARATEPILPERVRLRWALKAGYIVAVALQVVIERQVIKNYYETSPLYGIYDVVDD